MPGDVYNLGRATGLSAWEVYVRQSLLLNPDIEPLSEREWLSESIGCGDSMLLKITKDNIDSAHIRDFKFPANSLLGAPRTVIGSFFYGEGTATEDGWCTKVTDYGTGISNTQESHPENLKGVCTTDNIPSKENIDINNDKNTQIRMMQYIKIQDAIILQEGTWSDSGTESPARTFIPDITKPPVLRITFSKKITEDFYLLLTGFVNRAIIKGEVGFDMGSVIPDDEGEATAFRPENGDFLGPTLYPWANKVIFTYPGILTSLLRDNITSKSKNIKFNSESDDTTTQIELSELEAGLGIHINDSSTHEDPGIITISSRIQSSSENNYLGVDQNQKKTTDSTPTAEVMTTLKISDAKPEAGIGITQPKVPGGSYLIGAKISIDPGKGFKYLGINQQPRNNAEDTATTLTPAHGEAGPGISIDAPPTPGGAFKITSKVESLGDGQDYIKVDQTSLLNEPRYKSDGTLEPGSSIDQGARTTTTKLYPSRAVSGRGVGVSQPSTPGEDHVISALINTEGCGSKYLSVTQGDDTARSADDVATTLTPSKITSGSGIAITQPKTPGGDVTISSIMKSSGSAANYLKIDQEAHDSGCGCGCGDGKGAESTTTTVTPSRIVPASSESRITVSQPITPSGDIKIGTNINFTPHKGISIYDDKSGGVTHIGSVIATSGEGANSIKVEQGSIKVESSEAVSSIDNAPTTLIISKHVVDERNLANYNVAEDPDAQDVLTITYPATAGKDIVYYINVDEIIRRMLKTGAMKNFMESLLNKIYKGGTLNPDGSIAWPEGTENTTIPIGNLNIYSNDGQGEVFDNALRSRDGNTPNDLRMK